MDRAAQDDRATLEVKVTLAHRTFMDRLRIRYATPVDSGVDVDEITFIDDSGADENLERTLTTNLALLPIVEREVLTLLYLFRWPTSPMHWAFRSVPSGRAAAGIGMLVLAVAVLVQAYRRVAWLQAWRLELERQIREQE